MSRAGSRLWSSGRASMMDVPDEPTAFDLKVARLRLSDSPEKWPKDTRLRIWVKANRKHRYVPHWLLEEIGLADYEGDY